MKPSLLSAALLVPFCASAHSEIDARIRSINTEIARSTNSAQLHVRRSELHREHRDWAAALADIQRAASLDASLTRLDFFRARIFNDSNDTARSRALLDGYLLVNTNDCDAFLLSAKLFARSKEIQSAVDHYSRAIATSHDPSPELFLERANLLTSKGETSGALRGLDEGVEKTGGALTLHIRALELELAMTNRTAALSRLDKIIAASPRKESWLAKRGEICLQAGLKPEARQAFEAATEAIASLPLRIQSGDSIKTLYAEIQHKLQTLQNDPAIKPALSR